MVLKRDVLQAVDKLAVAELTAAGVTVCNIELLCGHLYFQAYILLYQGSNTD